MLDADDRPAIPLDIFLSTLNSHLSLALPLKEKSPPLSLKICRRASCCPICQEQIERKSPVFNLACKHHFHRDCLLKWQVKNRTCPLCRKGLK